MKHYMKLYKAKFSELKANLNQLKIQKKKVIKITLFMHMKKSNIKKRKAYLTSMDR